MIGLPQLVDDQPCMMKVMEQWLALMGNSSKQVQPAEF